MLVRRTSWIVLHKRLKMTPLKADAWHTQPVRDQDTVLAGILVVLKRYCGQGSAALIQALAIVLTLDHNLGAHLIKATA